MRSAPLIRAVMLSLVVPPAAAGLAAQTTIIDEGSFVLSRAGTRMGRESFVIRRIRSGGSDIMQITATSAIGDRRLTPTLETDSMGAPLRFTLDQKRGGIVDEQLRAQFSRGRASLYVRTKGGESSRESVVPEGAMMVDDEIFATYFLLARAALAHAAGRGTPVIAVVPRRNTQLSLRVEQRARDRIVIGGTPVNARELALIDAPGAQLHIWVDDQGRLLKVIDQHGVTAVREEAPR